MRHIKLSLLILLVLKISCFDSFNFFPSVKLRSHNNVRSRNILKSIKEGADIKLTTCQWETPISYSQLRIGVVKEINVIIDIKK